MRCVFVHSHSQWINDGIVNGGVEAAGISAVSHPLRKGNLLETGDQMEGTTGEGGGHALLLQASDHLHERVNAWLVDEGHPTQVDYQSFGNSFKL